MDHNINGLKISKMNYREKNFRYIQYKGFLVKFSIATDDMGTQICHNGAFFGYMDFKNIEEAIEYIKNNREKCIKFFRKVYIYRLKYQFSRRHIKFLVWKFRTKFNI